MASWPEASWYVESFESTLHQDLNGDGTTGAVTYGDRVVRRDHPDQGRGLYFVNYGGPSAVQINYGGAYAGANQFSGWAAIGAEQTISGYQVVWQNGGNYTVWNTDGAGNYRSQSSVIAGNSAAFAALEASFQQDINHDGSIAPSTAVEAAGSTILERAGSAYYLDAVGGLDGPSVEL